MLEILETIWGVLTYSHGPANVTFAIAPLVGMLGGGLLQALGGLFGGPSKKELAAESRWAPWLKAQKLHEEDAKDPGFLKNLLAGAGKGVKLTEGLTDIFGGAAKGAGGRSSLLTRLFSPGLLLSCHSLHLFLESLSLMCSLCLDVRLL